MAMRRIICPKCDGLGSIPDPREYGQAMRARRERAHITLRDMAGRLGITPSYLSDMELGRRSWPKKHRDRFTTLLGSLVGLLLILSSFGC
jgi:predicted transcriptional regulator